MVESGTTEVAALIFNWYCQLDRVELVDESTYREVEAILQTSMSLEQFRLMGNKLRSDAGFDVRRLQLREEWGEAVAAGLDEESANRFLAELFESFDHSLMFSHTLEAGRTTVRPGQPNDVMTAVGGNMPCWTLHLTTRGRALYTCGEDIQVGRGDVLLFSPGATCHYQRHPGSKLWVHEWFLFQQRSHWSLWMNWPEVGDGVFRIRIEDVGGFARLVELGRAIQDLSGEAPGMICDLQYNRLEELLIRLSGSLSSGNAENQDSRVMRACEYIRDRLASPFTVADVAAHCNVSPSRMAHLFQRHTGVGLMHWRNDLRMQQARKLLLEGDRSVTAIAHEIGYGDPTQFSKYFTKHIGVSPREFRNSFRDAASNT